MTVTDARVFGDGTIGELRDAVAGPVITPDDEGYDEARRVWNGSIDRHPALIVQCREVGDVVEAIRFARSEDLLVAVRGGGHNVAGHGTCDGGIVIDLGPMRTVTVDADAGLAHVDGGALWSDVDGATQPHGLATTGGLVSHTGVAGLTLGGGVGLLMRKHGLTCDNLVAAEVVTVDGAVVRTSETEEPDLFWALRGGGGNFGIVTSFTFRLHPVGEVLGGAMLVPLDRAAAFLRFVREAAPESPDDLTTILNLVTVPPAPQFPVEIHGAKALAVGFCHVGEHEAGWRAIEPFLQATRPLFTAVRPMPYAVRNQMQDPGAPAGCGNYWKSEYVGGLEDDLIDLMVDGAARATSPRNQIHIYPLGGAVARVAVDATAYSHRDAAYVVSYIGFWDDPGADPAPHVAWARDLWSGTRPHAMGTYVSFLGEEGDERVSEAYGADTYCRLAAIKATYDPDNVLRLNQNIKPATHGDVRS